MKKLLALYGERFTGGNAAASAREWEDAGFSPATARPWCEIGVWDAMTASAFESDGLRPSDVSAASERLIYDACNGSPGAYDAIVALARS